MKRIDQHDEREPVIFRKWRGDGEVIALFPQIPADNGGLLCLAYERVGEHGAASIPVVIRQTRLATQEEYRQLLEYLQHRRGYRLRVMRRVTRHDVEIRRRRARKEL